MAAHQTPLSLGFSRQEHWSGLPFPSPMHESEKSKWSCSVMSDPQWPHGLQPSRLLHPWDFPIKAYSILNFMPSPSSLLIESESVKSLSYVRLWDPMDCILPGSSVHGILQAGILERVAFPSPGGLPDPGIEPGSPALKAYSLPSVLPGKSQE